MGENEKDTQKNNNEYEEEDYQQNEFEIDDYEVELVRWSKYIKTDKKKELKKTRV